MTVNILYCEGNKNSLDMKIIGQLLAKKCEVKPIGSKNFFASSIIGDRAINPNLAGLVDRDFDCQDMPIENKPKPYNQNDIQLGWTWERKEIENYLLDPNVVKRALRGQKPSIDLDKYQSALDKAAEKIAAYTAARTALFCSGFSNHWGEEVKVSGTKYCFPKKLGKEACETNIRKIVEERKGDRIVQPKNVIEKFNQLLPQFRPGGVRFQNYLTFFAGKDLLYSIIKDLEEFGFQSSEPGTNSTDAFLKRIENGIAKMDDPWTLIPEWQELRQLIINTNFSTQSTQ